MTILCAGALLRRAASRAVARGGGAGSPLPACREEAVLPEAHKSLLAPGAAQLRHQGREKDPWALEKNGEKCVGVRWCRPGAEGSRHAFIYGTERARCWRRRDALAPGVGRRGAGQSRHRLCRQLRFRVLHQLQHVLHVLPRAQTAGLLEHHVQRQDGGLDLRAD